MVPRRACAKWWANQIFLVVDIEIQATFTSEIVSSMILHPLWVKLVGHRRSSVSRPIVVIWLGIIGLSLVAQSRHGIIWKTLCCRLVVTWRSIGIWGIRTIWCWEAIVVVNRFQCWDHNKNLHSEAQWWEKGWTLIDCKVLEFFHIPSRYWNLALCDLALP